MGRILGTAVVCLFFAILILAWINPPLTLGWGCATAFALAASVPAANFVWPRPPARHWTKADVRRFTLVNCVQHGLSIGSVMAILTQLAGGPWHVAVVSFSAAFLVAVALAPVDRYGLLRKRDEARRIAPEVFE